MVKLRGHTPQAKERNGVIALQPEHQQVMLTLPELEEDTLRLPKEVWDMLSASEKKEAELGKVAPYLDGIAEVSK